MQAYRDPAQLKQLWLHIEFLTTQRKQVTLYTSEKAAFVSAFGRASQEIPNAFQRCNWELLYLAIARLSIAVAQTYQDSRETAWRLADVLFQEAGFQMGMDDLLTTRQAFETIVQTKNEMEVADLFHHWKPPLS